jgi:hypothetical protein
MSMWRLGGIVVEDSGGMGDKYNLWGMVLGDSDGWFWKPWNLMEGFKRCGPGRERQKT